ncbi:MAG: ABC transporter ATP-binding protein/permease [Clostridia bacterium]|nr:ABC transporter ATP-binding protein/permease [Clostridia bacterium]
MPLRNENIQKPKNTGKTLRTLFRYMLKSWPLLLGALIATVVSNVCQLIGPRLCGYAIDATVGHVNFELVFYYAKQMLVLYIVSAVLGYVCALLVLFLSQRTVRAMRDDVFAKFMRMPVDYFDRHMTGDMLSHISYDIDTINESLSNDLVQILTSIITVVGAFSMMVRISPLLVIVFIFTVPLSVLFTRTMTRKIRPLYKKRSASLGQLNAFVEEHVSGLKITRAYHREDAVLDRFDERNEDAVTSYYNAEYYASVTGPSVNFINNLSLTLVSVFGALLFLGGKLSLGNISSFVLYSRKFSGPINEAANIFSELQSAMAAAERVFTLLEEDEEIADPNGAKPLVLTGGQVEFKDICFHYVPEREILKNVNLTAPSGSVIAIVGPTGSGKTTIVNLLMRFYDPQKGTIVIDGQDIAAVTHESLRNALTMVLQETWLFNGTIHDNIAYGTPNADRAQVIEAAKKTHIHEMITRLPHGYDTFITEDGVNLSKGQKQLITIARAMLRPAGLLILDEATSNVDIRTEVLIRRAMLDLMAGKTCFVIAHRLSTIRSADCILAVKDGEIVEKGTHDELMAAGGYYAELFNAQFI